MYARPKLSSFYNHDVYLHPESEANFVVTDESGDWSLDENYGEISASEELRWLLHLQYTLKDEGDENDLTNLIFYTRHPSLKGKPGASFSQALKKEWVYIRNKIVRAVYINNKKIILKKGKRHGYYAYAGGRVDNVLKALKKAGRLSGVSNDEIEMLKRMSNVETGGNVQGVFSIDNVFMSMGFMQWPILFYKKIGKLQRLVDKAPTAFRKYGIELDRTRHYRAKIGRYTYKSIAFKGIKQPKELHSLKWAKRFLRAGLDTDIIVAETKLALVVVEESRKRIVRHLKRNKQARGQGLDTLFTNYYNRSVVLRALVQETYNHRPAYLYKIMLKVTKQAKGKRLTDQQFLALTQKEIKNYYTAKGKPKSGENIVNKTAKL